MAGWPNNWHLRTCTAFVTAAIIGLGVLAVLIYTVGNGTLFQVLYDGGRHYAWAFPLTHLGDSLILCALLAWVYPVVQWHRLLAAILLIILTGLVAQALKHGLYADWVRPVRHYGQHLAFAPHTPGVHSFPSGHATSVFTAAVCMIAVWRGRVGQVLVVGAALVLGLTRIWSGAHFPLDVLAGSCLGLGLGYVLLPLLLRGTAPLSSWRWGVRTHQILRVVGVVLALAQWAQLTWAIFP